MARRGPPIGSPKPPGSGRQKGTTNKSTEELRQMILRALDEQPGGGVCYLRKVAVSHPVAFLSLLGRVLPLTMQGNPEKPVAISFAWASDAERPALTQDGAEVKDDAEVEQ